MNTTPETVESYRSKTSGFEDGGSVAELAARLELPSERAPVPQDEATERHLERIDKWRKAIAVVTTEIAGIRESLESHLADRQAAGLMDKAQIAAHQVEIDNDVARGARREYVYNHSTDPKYRRTQAYFLTIDAHGHIWADYEPATAPIGITGRPKPAGRRILVRNPTIPYTQY